MVTHKVLYEYFPNLTKQQYEQIELLCERYIYWNDKINVISRKDIENIFEQVKSIYEQKLNA